MNIKCSEFEKTKGARMQKTPTNWKYVHSNNAERVRRAHSADDRQINAKCFGRQAGAGSQPVAYNVPHSATPLVSQTNSQQIDRTNQPADQIV